MGWKYTEDIKRKEALNLIYEHLESLTNEELGDVMGVMFGDTSGRPYYGANFNVYEDLENE